MNIVEMMRAASQPEQLESVERLLVGRIEHAKTRLALYEKALAEVQAIGTRKIDRIIQMCNGEDPDATKPVHVGPHGPGCECQPEELDADDPACQRH
jgi:hypothetical protein